MQKLINLDNWMNEISQKLLNNPDEVFDIQKFKSNNSNRNNAVLKLILLNGYSSQYGYDYFDVITVKQELAILKEKHPKTDLSDLKSLNNWYPKLEANLNGLVFNPNDPNEDNKKQDKQIMTNQMVVDLLNKHIDEFKQDNNSFSENQIDVLVVVDYLLKKKLSDELELSMYQNLINAIMTSKWSDHGLFWQYFKENDDIKEALQNNIHDIATSQDEEVQDDWDDWNSPTYINFDGYDDYVIDELAQAIEDYRDYMKQKPVITYFEKNENGDDVEQHPAKVEDFINFLNNEVE